MLNRLLPLCLFLAASCVAVASRIPTALVELDVQGSPVIGPGGPSIYIDDVYRGNPVGSTFSIWLTEGEHDIRLMGGSEVLWEGELYIDPERAKQRIDVRYQEDGSGSATTID